MLYRQRKRWAKGGTEVFRYVQKDGASLFWNSSARLLFHLLPNVFFVDIASSTSQVLTWKRWSQEQKQIPKCKYLWRWRCYIDKENVGQKVEQKSGWRISKKWCSILLNISEERSSSLIKHWVLSGQYSYIVARKEDISIFFVDHLQSAKLATGKILRPFQSRWTQNWM